MDAPLLTPQELIRPWRRAAIIVAAIAAVELVLLVGAGIRLVARPLAHEIRQQAISAAAPRTPAVAQSKQLRQAIRRMNAPAGKARRADPPIRPGNRRSAGGGVRRFVAGE